MPKNLYLGKQEEGRARVSRRVNVCRKSKVPVSIWVFVSFHNARLSEGWLDVCVFFRGDRFQGMIMVSHLLLERFALAGRFVRYRAEPPESASKLLSVASGTLYLRRITVVFMRNDMTID